MSLMITETQKQLIAKAREFALEEVAPYAQKWDIDEHIPREQIQKLADAGYFGMTFPEKYGGKNYSTLDAVLIIEEIAKHCTISGRLIVDHNFGAVGTILNFGTEKQQRVLPTITRGGIPDIQKIGIASHVLGRSLPQHRDDNN